MTARRASLAAAVGGGVGVLGGLIGLGGAELRLPFLRLLFGLEARRVVALNLAISLVTLVASIAQRLWTTPLEPLRPLAPVIVALAIGAMAGAYAGASLAHRVSRARLELVTFVLLFAVGIAMGVEPFLPEHGGRIADGMAALLPLALAFGVAIGTVSSLLGVAGGEMLIPTLLFVFGLAVKPAGTAASMVSFALVSVGCVKHARAGAFADRAALHDLVVPMGLASIAGALVGARLVSYVPSEVLKVALGLLLVGSSIRIFTHARPTPLTAPAS